MHGFGVSLFSPFESSIIAFGTRWGLEDPAFLRLWRRVWKSRLPMKIRVFAWLLLCRRLQTRSLRQRKIRVSSSVHSARGSGRLRTYVRHLLFRHVCPATGQSRPSRALILGGFLEFYRRQTISANSGVAAHLCHPLVHLESSKRSHFQGSYPLSRCHSARCERTGYIMVLTRLRPADSCTLVI